MTMANAKQGGKNRKYGRASRHPAMLAYKSARRWESNKKKRIARHIRRMERKALKLARRLAKEDRAQA